MTKLSSEIQIDASKEKVWGVLADLETVQHYSPAITKAYYTSEVRDGVGAARQCDFDGGYVRERVTEWKPGEGYAINVYEGSDIAPFESIDVRFVLRDAEQGTAVSLELEYRLKPDAPSDPQEIESEYRQLIEGVLAGLKRYVETGELVGDAVPASESA